MQRFNLGKDFQIPEDAVTQTFSFIAKRGMGKTYAAIDLNEEMLKAGYQTVAIDPVGVWYGLRIGSEGKGPGLPVLVLGGEHGDIPLTFTSGEAVAKMVIAQGISVVLDLSLMRKGQQIRFVGEFSETLYRENRKPLHVFIDEADAFCPQTVAKVGEEGNWPRRTLGAVEDLVRRGRARGLGCTLISQRAAVINKNVLTQTEVMVALRTISPQDQAAIKAWISAHDVQGQAHEMMSSLASLEIGEAWVWSPGWLDTFKRVKFRKRLTFDSSSTPTMSKTEKRPTVLGQLPEGLVGKIKEILSPNPPPPKPPAVKAAMAIVKEQPEPVAKEPGPAAFYKSLHDRMLKELRQQAYAVEKAAQQSLDYTRRLIQMIDAQAHGAVVDQFPTPVKSNSPSARASRNLQRPVEAQNQTGGLSAPQQRILDSLAEFNAVGIIEVGRANLASWCGASSKSSGFSNNLSNLRSRGCIDYAANSCVILTPGGRNAANAPEIVLTLAGLHDAWKKKLSGPQGRILDLLIAAFPQPVERESLAEQLGVSSKSSGYSNNISALSGLGIACYPSPGYVGATALLFPEKLR